MGFFGLLGFGFFLVWCEAFVGGGLGFFPVLFFTLCAPAPSAERAAEGRCRGGQVGGSGGQRGLGSGCARHRAWCRGGDAATPPALPPASPSAVGSPAGPREGCKAAPEGKEGPGVQQR